jgi:hypothetical protein
MEKLVRTALAALFLLGIASAQNIPAIEVFGGYSYLNFDTTSPSGSNIVAQRLGLQGWNVSFSAHVFHRIAAEADISGHSLSTCENITNLSCSDTSYMFGPRFKFGKSSSRITAFVHGLAGEDNATLVYNQGTVSDTSFAFAVGGGVDYWITRHIGAQLGPADFFWTQHLKTYDAPSQNNIRVSGGIIFRFGGESQGEPSPRSRRYPTETQPATAPARQPATQPAQPAQPAVAVPGRGMSLPALGVVVVPQEFDGAKILEIVPGGVAEMASLKAGDLIRSVDGKAVKTPMELAAELSDKTGKVRIGILRGDFATETLILLGR